MYVLLLRCDVEQLNCKRSLQQPFGADKTFSLILAGKHKTEKRIKEKESETDLHGIQSISKIRHKTHKTHKTRHKSPSQVC